MPKRSNKKLEFCCPKGHIFECSKGTIDLENNTITQEKGDNWQSDYCPQCIINEIKSSLTAI